MGLFGLFLDLVLFFLNWQKRAAGLVVLHIAEWGSSGAFQGILVVPDCCCGSVPLQMCASCCAIKGEGCLLPGIHLAGLTGMDISPSSHEYMLSIEKVFSGTWSQPDREGCFLQLLRNTFQYTLTNTTAGINCYMVDVLKGL